MSTARLLRTLVLLTALISMNAAAGVTFAPLGADQYRVTLDPLSFTLGVDANDAGRMIIEDFFSTNSTDTLSVAISGSMRFSLNGGPELLFDFVSNNGAFAGTAGAVDANDLLFNFRQSYLATGPGALTAGDVVTLSTIDMVFENDTPGLSSAGGAYTARLLENITEIASTLVAQEPAPVPEPSMVVLLLVAIGGALRRASPIR
jgi:hypothetical protein